MSGRINVNEWVEIEAERIADMLERAQIFYSEDGTTALIMSPQGPEDYLVMARLGTDGQVHTSSANTTDDGWSTGWEC